MNVNRVDYFVCMGNTYGNLDELRALGAKFDNGARTWSLKISTHPMNNVKQKKKLEARLTALEERGVRFVAWYIDGGRA